MLRISASNFYSFVVQVVSTDFADRKWSDANAYYTVVIEAAIDNSIHGLDLELAPWS